MGTLNIGGKLVTVDDSFRNLSPADQQKTVDEISSQMVDEQSANNAPWKNDPIVGQTGQAQSKTFLITAPDGRKFNVTGDNAEGAMAALHQHLNSGQSWQNDPVVSQSGQPGSANLFVALRNAHNAGDTVAAQRIAGMIKAQGQSSAQAQTPVPWYTPITSAPGNAYDVGKSLYNTVVHPIDTLSGIASLGNGAIANIPGVGAVNDWAVNHALSPAYDKTREAQDQQVARAAGQQVKQNFGTPTAAWNTVATHPVDTLLTAAPVIGQVGKMADAAGLARTATLLGKTSEFTNPVALTAGLLGKTATLSGKAATYPLGLLSGSSPEAFQMAAKAGQEGGDAGVAFRNAMRGKEAPEAVVNDAKAALGKLADQRRANYLAGMKGTASSGAVVDTAPIRQSLNDLRDSLYVSPKPMLGDNASRFSPLQKGSAGDIKTLDTIDQLLTQWEAHPEGRTPLAMDALKQRLDELQPAFGNPALDNQRRLVTRMQNAIKDQITSVEPSYAKAMTDYATSKAAQTEIEKSLGLGRAASADTALNKFKTAIGGERANRAANIAQLEQLGAPNIMNRLAGQSLSPRMPKGLVGKILGAGLGYSSWLNPLHVGLLPLASPRVVGELAHTAGRVSRKVPSLLGDAGFSKRRLIQTLLGGQLLQAGGQ